MEYKEDIDEAKERMSAWWDREIIDRPVFSYYFPKKRGKLGAYLDIVGENWDLAQDYEGIENALNGIEKRAEITYYGGESIPSYFPNYGPGIVAAVFGVKPKFQSNTVWFSRPTKIEDITDYLESVKLDQNNEWYSRLLRITEYAAKRAGRNYTIAQTDLGGVLDTLSAFLGPTNMILAMKRKPEIINTCRSIILEKLIHVYDKLQDIIDKYGDGCSSWLNVWCGKRSYPMQCDFSAMLNPKWFKRFALPDLVAQAEHMDYAIYHLDGPNALPHLDPLLAEPAITGIQWVPGAGSATMGSETWISLYKRIQKAEKNVVIDASPEEVSNLYKNLDSKGLFVRTFYRTEFITNLYLPKFMGGIDGKLIFKARNWIEKQGKKKLTKEELEEFLILEGIELNNKFKKDLLKEINSSMTEKNLV